MKKVIGLFIFITLSFTEILANNISVKLNPKEPVLGNSFELIFTIETDSDEEPYISFDPRGATVLGRKNSGVSVSTTILNGRMSVKREVTYVYELEAERAGPLRITNIKVDVGDEALRARDIRTTILRESRKPKDVFVLAVPNKTSVFVGEGIDIVYYLYRRVPVGNKIVETYPKLNKFIKRFHMLRSNREEAVEYQGMAYRRLPVYSARAYPEKLGKAYIDPLKMKIEYAVSGHRGGMFGFGLRQMRTKSIRSRKVEVQVKPVPTENIPPNFTGLVGEHDFRVTTTKNKHLVNEAIEIKLIVEGEGALENYDAPPIYEHQDMEEFDTKAELSEMGKSRGRKVFDYTYLARAPLKVPSREVSFSYFDPNNESFVEKRVVLPALLVGGAAAAAKTGSSQETARTEKEKDEPETFKKASRGLLAPLFYPAKVWQLSQKNWLKYLNIILVVVVLFLIGNLGYTYFFNQSIKDQAGELCNKMKKEGINYSYLHKLIHLLSKEGEKESSLTKVLERAEISTDTKKYFDYLVEKSEQETFKQSGPKTNLEYKSSHFQEITTYIRKQNDKNTESTTA